jgi:hypothetical protein
MDRLHWRHLLAKPSAATVTLGGMTVLALATLGGVTSNRNNPICIASPKVAKASTMVTVACNCHQHYHRHYHSKLCKCKHSFKAYLQVRFQTMISQLASSFRKINKNIVCSINLQA